MLFSRLKGKWIVASIGNQSRHFISQCMCTLFCQQYTTSQSFGFPVLWWIFHNTNFLEIFKLIPIDNNQNPMLIWKYTCATSENFIYRLCNYYHQYHSDHSHVPDISLKKCEGEKMTLSCPSNHAIRVTRAIWKSHVNQECGWQTLSSQDSCDEKSVVGKWNELCRGKKTCTIELSTTKFGDARVGIPKQMELSYTCGEYMSF